MVTWPTTSRSAEFSSIYYWLMSSKVLRCKVSKRPAWEDESSPARKSKLTATDGRGAKVKVNGSEFQTMLHLQSIVLLVSGTNRFATHVWYGAESRFATRSNSARYRSSNIHTVNNCSFVPLPAPPLLRVVVQSSDSGPMCADGTDAVISHTEVCTDGVTIHRTGPHRTAPGNTGPHRTTPDRTGSVPGRKWLIISLTRRIERRKTS